MSSAGSRHKTQRLANTGLLSFILLGLLLAPGFPEKPEFSVQNLQSKLDRAAQYLLSHFSEQVGLVYESEDSGAHWLSEEFPGYGWSYNRTFWLYSDNLFASLALAPFSDDHSKRIRETISKAGAPPSGLFEVVAGERIGEIRNPSDVILASTREYALLLRIHNGTRMDPSVVSVDTYCYEALNEFIRGDRERATSLIRKAASLWSPAGLVEESLLVDGFRSNYKLALLLFVARVVQVDLPDWKAMESGLWKMQLSNGGIASLSDISGAPLGSVNAETTSLTILIYDMRHILYLRKLACGETCAHDASYTNQMKEVLSQIENLYLPALSRRLTMQALAWVFRSKAEVLSIIVSLLSAMFLANFVRGRHFRVKNPSNFVRA